MRPVQQTAAGMIICITCNKCSAVKICFTKKRNREQRTFVFSAIIDLDGNVALRSPPDAGAMQKRARLANETGKVCILDVDDCAKTHDVLTRASLRPSDYSCHGMQSMQRNTTRSPLVPLKMQPLILFYLKYLYTHWCRLYRCKLEQQRLFLLI